MVMIFDLQQRLQYKLLKDKELDIAFGRNTTVGETYDYVSKLRFFIEEEITELLEELGNGSRDIHKPWKQNYNDLRNVKFVSTDRVKEEAMDMLCFAINLCIAVGLTHTHVKDVYMAVYQKNNERCDNTK